MKTVSNCFVSWSGGKDALFALHTLLQENPTMSATLLNMCDADKDQSKSHGISAEILRRQTRALGLPMHQAFVDERGYEAVLKEAVELLKKSTGCTHGIFGDIYLQGHRDWIERVCEDLGVTPLFPLWGHNTTELLASFVATGYKTMVLAVQEDQLDSSFLGRTIDTQFIADLPQEIDPCGEKGEYHTFVYDGPLFTEPVVFSLGENRYDDKQYRLTLQ